MMKYSVKKIVSQLKEEYIEGKLMKRNLKRALGKETLGHTQTLEQCRRLGFSEAAVLSVKAKTEGEAAVKPKRNVSRTSGIFLGGAVKQIWDHIKLNNLQNPANKKEIICDNKLKELFNGKEKVNFLEIGKLLSPHFVKAE